MKILFKYLFVQSPEKSVTYTANYLWPVLTSRCCKNLKHLSHCKESMYFCSHKMESTAGLFYVSAFNFRKSIAWKHVSVSISCMTFSISAEIFHHYVPYVEFRATFVQNMKQNTQIWMKMPVQAELCVMQIFASFYGTPVYTSSPLFVFCRTAVIRAHSYAGEGKNNV